VWQPGIDQCAAIMPRFISATRHQARTDPATHRSRAHYRQAAIIATNSAVAAGLPVCPTVRPCRPADTAASAAHARRPRTAVDDEHPGGVARRGRSRTPAWLARWRPALRLRAASAVPPSLPSSRLILPPRVGR
jgi:hypothetical protein